MAFALKHLNRHELPGACPVDHPTWNAVQLLGLHELHLYLKLFSPLAALSPGHRPLGLLASVLFAGGWGNHGEKSNSPLAINSRP